MQKLLDSRVFLTVLLILAFLIITHPLWAQTIPHDMGWKDNSTNEDGFKIERKLGAGGTYEEVGQVGKDVTTFVDNAPDGQVYFYRVKAFNVVRESGYSNEAPATGVIDGPTQLIVTTTTEKTTTTKTTIKTTTTMAVP